MAFKDLPEEEQKRRKELFSQKNPQAKKFKECRRKYKKAKTTDEKVKVMAEYFGFE